jgi:hypothetical protein
MKKITNLSADWDSREKREDENDKWFEELQKYSWDNEENEEREQIETNPNKCNHAITFWLHLNSKYKLKICSRCGKELELTSSCTQPL